MSPDRVGAPLTPSATARQFFALCLTESDGARLTRDFVPKVEKRLDSSASKLLVVGNGQPDSHITVQIAD